jgi:hypothetical protein
VSWYAVRAERPENMASANGSRKRRPPAMSYDDVLAVTRLFDDFSGVWVVCGGWALDLFIGRQTREHEDLDVAIDSGAQHLVHAQLAGWRLSAKLKRASLRWSPGMQLGWPEYEITALCRGHRPSHFHVILNDLYDDTWRLPMYAGLERTAPHWRLYTDDGIPFVAPEVALLDKNRMHRPKDESDLQAALELMDAEQRAWLRGALERFAPRDPWIARLAE